MGFRAFWTENNQGGGAGNDMAQPREVGFSQQIDDRGRCHGSAAVISGLTLSPVANALSVDVNIGRAIINGHTVEVHTAAERRTGLTPSATNYIYLKYGVDGSGNVNSISLDSNTTGTPPANSVVLGRAVTDADDVTSVFDYSGLGLSHKIRGAGLTQLFQLTATTSLTSHNLDGLVPRHANMAILVIEWDSEWASGAERNLEISLGAESGSTLVMYNFRPNNDTGTGTALHRIQVLVQLNGAGSFHYSAVKNGSGGTPSVTVYLAGWL